MISSKIDKEVSAHTSHSILINGADELANSATGVAFGSPVDLTSLAGNMVGDEVGEAADYYGKQIKLHASNDPGDSHKKPTPASYANSIQSTQTAPTFVSQDASANDPLYHLYRNQNDYTSEAFGSMDDADYASAHASHHSQVDHERLMGMQRGAVAKASWENRIEDKCMQFAANIAMLNLNAMHMFAHGITAQNLMNPFDSMEEAYSGHDPLNGRSVGLGQAYVDFGESMVAFGVTSVGGIADTIGAGVENLAANTARLLSDIPSVGRNVASMFGNSEVNALSPMRLRVMQNIAEARVGNEASNFSVFSNRSNALNIELKMQNGPLSNSEVRYWYNETTAQIPKLNEQWIRHGIGLEDRSVNAYEIRHCARLQARSMMSNFSEVEMLQARDLEKYGNPEGPTYEYLYNSYRSTGYSEQEAFQAIIDSSPLTSSEYNVRFKP